MLHLSPATRILNENPACSIYHDSVGSSEKSVIKHPSFLMLPNTCSKNTSMVKFTLKEHNQRKQCLQYLQALLSFCLVNWPFIDQPTHCPYPFFLLLICSFRWEERTCSGKYSIVSSSRLKRAKGGRRKTRYHGAMTLQASVLVTLEILNYLVKR